MDNNWNSLLQKLGTKVPEQNPRSFEETNLNAGLLQQLAHLAQVSTDQSAIPFQPNELSLAERDDPNISSKSDKAASSALIVNFIEENSDIQINDVKNFAADQRSGRTIALNSRFVCYQDTNNTVVIKSLKNLSLNYRIDNLNARIADIAFLDDILTNYLAVVTTEGILLVISIDLNQAKDKVVLKYFLKHNFEKTCERVQIQWKDQSKIGVVVDNQLVIFELPTEDSSSDSEENTPKASFQEPFQTEINIRDFTFSPNYPLVYFLLENNNVQIFNIENRALVNEFAPHSSGTVLRVLSYKSLIRHEPVKSDDKSLDVTLRDIFLTVTEGFEIKVWDLSEWDQNKKSYYCIETFQLPQSNDNIDPIALIKRFVFYDAGLNFIFVVFKTNDDRGICLNALHIDNFYSGYSDIYDQVKKNKRFFNSTQTVFLKKNDLTDLSVLNLADDEMDFYFKKNTYPLMADTEPASTRTQDGSYAYSTKTVLSFFTHAESSISVFRTIGEKLYPLGFIEEFEKINQVEQLESQSDSSYPPDLPGFVKKLHQETKNQARRGEERKDEAESMISPEVVKQPTSQKKKQGKDHKKDVEGDGHEHGKHNKGGQPTKIVTRTEKEKGGAGQGKSATEADAQSQALDKILEKRFQELTDKSIQQLNNKFSKIEEIIENKVNERVSKLHSEAITNSLSRELDEKLQREFSHAFEKTVTPCFERYLGKMFEQVCASFEKGNKFYIDKLNVEQAKGAQIKETMNEVVKSFVQISNSLTESYANNQATFNKMESNIQDKQGQISRLIDQMNEIIQRQHEIQKKLNTIESEGPYHQKEAYPKNPYMYPVQGQNQFYGKSSKDNRVSHPLNDQLAYLQSIIGGKPLDLSGGGMMQPPRGAGTSSPGANSQVFDNPYQQHGYPGYYNPYQKAAGTGGFNPNFPTGNQSGGQSGEGSHAPFYNPAQGGVQPPPELQAFYQNYIQEMLKLNSKEKEEEKEKASPYLPNMMAQDNAKKFFDLAQIAQGQPTGNAGDLRGQRTLSQVEAKTNLPPLALNPTSSQPHEPEGVSSRSSTPLPPGIHQPANQGNQPNFVQNLLQNLPASMQQQFAQAQLTPQKVPGTFPQSQPQTAGQTPSNQQGQKHGQIGAGFNPELYFGNPNNFPGYYGVPNQMNNAQINRSSGTKTTVDINQIPLVNSMFKTPSRDANDETSSTGGTNNNLS